jgi:hypothetical protein
LRARDTRGREAPCGDAAATPRHEPVTLSNLCFVTIFIDLAQQAVPRGHTP